MCIAGRIYRLESNEDEAEQRCRKLVGGWLKNGGPGSPPPETGAMDAAPARPTVAAVVAEYLERGVRPGINVRNRARIYDAIKLVAEKFPDLPADQIGVLELKRVRDDLGRRRTRAKCSERGKHVSRPVSRRYINSHIGCVKTAWDWLGSERLVPGWRAHELRMLRAWEERDGGRETADILPAPIDPVEKAIEHMNANVAAMVKLQQLTGMRPNEVRRMKRAEISTCAAEVLHLKNALPTAAMVSNGVIVWVYAPTFRKTRRKGETRLIALGPMCQEILKPFLQGLQPADVVFRPVEATKGRAMLCGKPVADEYSITSYAHAVRRACVAAGVPPWKPNQLRHALATELFPDDPLKAMATLVHSQIAMTAYYAAASLKRAAEHAAKAG